MATKVKTGVIDSSAITSALIANASITADDLHTTLDLTGKTVTVSTATAGDNDTSVASTAYVDVAIANLADSAPSTLNTLNELAAALGDDANYATTTTNAIAAKLPLAGGTMTGALIVADDQELQLGNSADIKFKHHNSGYGHLENTGILYIDAEQIQLRTDNSDVGLALTLNSSHEALFAGNVGIGTTNPDSPLEISGADDTRLKLTDTGDSSELMLRSDGVNTQIYTNTAHDLGIYTSGNVGQLHLKQSNGNVGIGTTNPAQNFVVAAATNGIGIELVPGTLNYIQAYNRGTSDYGDLKIDAQSIRFGTDNGTERARISSAGRLHINHTNDPGWDSLGTLVVRQIANDRGIGVVDANSQNTFKMLNNETYAELHYNVNLPIIFTQGTGGGTERMRIHTGGNVGIGAAAPTELLHIKNPSNSWNEYARIRIGTETSDSYASEIGFHRGTSSDVDRGLFLDGSGAGNQQLKVLVNGNVGIGTAAPKDTFHIATDANGDGFAFGGKNLSLSTSYGTGAQLEIGLADHQGCYVKVFITGDWSGHSAMAFLGEYFIQNGANAYAEPGMIIREVENTHGSDSLSSQIYDGGNYNSFQIQFKLNASSGTAPGKMTYQVMGQFDSIT